MKKHLFREKNNKGFTLVEMILSIAALAIAAGFILQLFILSADTNRRAEAENEALMRAKSIVSVFKSVEDPDELIEGDVFGLGQPEYLEGDKFQFKCNYNANWEKANTPSENGYVFRVVLQKAEDRSEDMNKIKYLDGNSGDIVYQYWNLYIEVDLNKKGSTPEKILDTKNDKYFVYLKEQ